jgi:hypothetical protein
MVEPRVFLFTFPDDILMMSDAKDQLFSDWQVPNRALRPNAQ